MSDRPILLTGSAGFVGTAIKPMIRLAFPNRPLAAIVRCPPAPPGGYAMDLAERDATDAMVRAVKPGLVFHLAAHSSVGTARNKPSAVWRDNLQASAWVARAIARHAPDAIVLLASTAEVYGRSLNDGPATEQTLPRPHGPYACSKLAAEYVFRDALPSTAALIIARPFNHVGLNQSEVFAVPSFAMQLARIEAGLSAPVIRVGNLEARRDFMDVRDVAACYVRLVAVGRTQIEPLVVNVASGKPVAIGALLNILLRLAGVTVTIEKDAARMRRNEVPVATAATERLRALIGPPPQRALETTLSEVLVEKRAKVAALLTQS